MSLNRAEKEQEVTDIKAIFDSNELLVVTQYSGLTVAQLTDLRTKLRAEGASFRVAKNTLVKRALKGTKFEGAADLFKGPTGFASSKDPLAAARVAYEFAKTNDKLIILGGATANENLDLSKIKTLALLPSLDSLRGKIIGILQAPAAQLARLANAYAEKGGVSTKAEAAPAAAAVEAPAAEAAAVEAPAAETPSAE